MCMITGLKFFEDLVNLFYPRICLACGNSLYAREEVICTYCRFRLPKTNFHLLRDNPVQKAFWGRADTESATSFLYFSKGGMVQQLLHHLKYRNRKDVGIYLGRLFAIELQQSVLFENIDTIIPVPLHPKKQKKRGYNQSEQIALGMNQILKVDLLPDALVRTRFTETQTKKSRYERWLNVGEMFAVKNKYALRNKNILLIDDVITTGATLEACVHGLQRENQLKVYIGSIAYAFD